jgi:hypothetical protein
MKHHKVPNSKPQQPFTTAAESDAVPPDDQDAPFVPSEDEVAYRAYLKFENQGAADGHDVTHWLTAETELIAERAQVKA